MLYIPPQYMSKDASIADREVYLHFKKTMCQIEDGSIKGIILPSVLDGNGRQLFRLEQPMINFTLPNINSVEQVGDVLIMSSEKLNKQLNIKLEE